MPSSEAIGLTQTAPQAPLLHTVKNSGMIELKLPVMVVQIDFIHFLFYYFVSMLFVTFG
jgi:hypothetical protein